MSWAQVVAQVPDLAAVVEDRLTAHRHHTLATLRRDGSPRISGTEVMVVDGELWLGSMPGARKAQDLQRDPRFALHSASDDPQDADPSAWPGDAKLAGRAVEVVESATQDRILGDPGAGGSQLFRLDVDEVVTTVIGAGGQHLEITLWTPERGVLTFQRT